jgi:hypothetical protein
MEKYSRRHKDYMEKYSRRPEGLTKSIDSRFKNWTSDIKLFLIVRI